MIHLWHEGTRRDPGAGIPADHPLVRWGEGLFETMRAEGGTVPLADAHLQRLRASLTALAIADPPEDSDLEAALAEVTPDAADGPARLRLTAGADRLVIAEATPIAPISPDPGEVSAAVTGGEWAPGRTASEHKTVSYLGYRDAARRAGEAGADVALLTDSHGRLGEADRGNLIAVIDGEVRTPPVRGILPGIARAWALRWEGLSEGPIKAAEREVATEIVMCNAVEGFSAITTVDGLPVGDGTAGAYARGAQSRFAAQFA